jgi:predicted NUDIX family NTP pyrophosphohydrolase
MPKKSAGILLYRRDRGDLEVFLAHPGGPFWKNRDRGAWTIPKGEIGDGEDPFAAAKREFAEEIGFTPVGPSIPLKPLRQPGGKTVWAWAVEGDRAAAFACSNSFRMEWPPRSGQFDEFPEIDRAEWFSLAEAKEKILPGQAPFLSELESFP